MVLQVLRALAGPAETGGDIGRIDVDTFNPQPHNIFLGLRELCACTVFGNRHELVQCDAGLVLWDNGKVRQARDGELTVGLSDKGLTAVDELLDSLGRHRIESGLLPGLEGEEGLHPVVLEHIQQGGQGLQAVYILVDLVDIAGKPFPAQLGPRLEADGEVGEDSVPNRILEVVLAVDRVEVGVQGGQAAALGQHFRLEICHQQGGDHTFGLALILVKEHLHPQQLLHQGLDHLDERIL